MFQKRKVGTVLGAALATGALVAVSFAGPAYAGGGKGGGGHGGGHGNSGGKSASEVLRKAVTADGITRHLQALQDVADANGGNRAAGTPGHVASADYMEAKLKRAGYTTWRQPFSYDKTVVDTAALQQLTPTPTTYGYQVDFVEAANASEGDVSAAVEAVDINLTGDRASTSGCEAADFADFTIGAIALVQRGTCDFRVKADNALAAGAVGVIIFNQGNDVPGEDRLGLFGGTLGDTIFELPVATTTFALGEQFATTEGVTARLAFDAHVETIDTFNLFADSRGNPNETVVVGGHLDGVLEGPGINDNGSGTASILETALQMSKKNLVPKNQVRFAFWSGEEDGLQGSNYYVSQLTEAQIAQHALNLNFDMVGSPNAVRFVYDGDGSAFGLVGPEGSDAIEANFTEFFASQGLASEPTAFDGRSDYFAFIEAGIPAGGLFSGAEDIKSAEQAAIYGGTAGEAFDPCYHQECDDISNIDPVVLEQMADAIAHSTATFAETKTKHHGGKGHGKGHWRTDHFDHKGPHGRR
ncbi:M20/M25/M40 family metallo-hydrolase [Mycetocola zhadangensis]|uniref:M20/M25/M40 family metallo-hydrolase n=1 Tax=Mycetocola zhadangensis TaxID=1164595 RepID=A0A3L7J1A9_9MICO|nr:M20/M25/M40 family metallo-hydrolase [Mycetocola zhadangensis]RLQ84179.1 M20/M25/M40 family metallo-hydrolase [Mycetocola zhadangensis]GGE95423.1 aminopeptidase [Mycetocola zhadangensis]